MLDNMLHVSYDNLDDCCWLYILYVLFVFFCEINSTACEGIIRECSERLMSHVYRCSVSATGGRFHVTAQRITDKQMRGDHMPLSDSRGNESGNQTRHRTVFWRRVPQTDLAAELPPASAVKLTKVETVLNKKTIPSAEWKCLTCSSSPLIIYFNFTPMAGNGYYAYHLD